MKPFNLEAFKAGQKALTRKGRIATFIGINFQLHKNSQLVTVLDDNDYTTFYYINGNYNKDEEHKLDLVSMVSRHQALINSYDPEDTWQIYNPNLAGVGWRTITGDASTWDEYCEYRLHPHNDLIKAWKKGAKIECKHKDKEWRDASSDDIRSWYEDAEYRIKPEPTIHCLCYNPGHVHGEFSWSPSLATKELAVANGWKIIQEWEV